MADDVLTILHNVGQPLTIEQLQSRMKRWHSWYDLERALARLVKQGRVKEGPAMPARSWTVA